MASIDFFVVPTATFRVLAETGLKYVRAIEKGRVLKPLKSFDP
jgi:hypothetical protein